MIPDNPLARLARRRRLRIAASDVALVILSGAAVALIAAVFAGHPTIQHLFLIP